MNFYDLGIVQFFSDISEFFKFKKDIKRVEMIRDSEFNNFKLKHNKLGNIVYVQLNFEENDYRNADYDEKFMVDKKLGPIVTYLSETLGWGEYLRMQISNFVDDDGNKSLTYCVMFIFEGYAATLTNVFITTLLLTLCAVGLGVWGIIEYLS